MTICRFAASAVAQAVVTAALLMSYTANAATPVNSDWWVDIANDRIGAIKTRVGRGVDVNVVDPKGQPAIMQAIRDQAWSVYDYLATHPNLQVNVVNANQETPLMYLAVVGETQRAQALIRRGADINRLGWTPLHYAASTGKVDTAQMLIQHKAIINAPGPDGTTPLMMAAYSGSEPMVQLLLRSGADPTVRNTQNQNAADWARLKQHTNLGNRLDELIAQSQRQRAAREQAIKQGGQGQVNTLDLTGSQSPGADPSSDPADTSQSKQSEAPASAGYFDFDRDYDKAAP